MLALALWLAGFGVAHAEPPPTLVLVAPPTPLVDAVTTGLGPWQIRVVVVTAPMPADQAAATYRATYVATVRGTTLELFHVGEPGVQTRDVPAQIDDVEAASIALTLKTWMRLGPPPTDGATPVDPPPPLIDPPPPQPPPPPPPAPPRLAGFASVGFGVRFDQGGFGTRERLVLAAGVATPLIDGFLTCDLGSDIDVDRTTVWSEALIGAHLGHRVRLGRGWSIRPRIGVGALRSRVEGLNAASGKTVTVINYSLFFDAAADVLWRRGPWLLGATAALTGVPADLEIRGQLRVTAPARVEPWLAISAGLQFP
ncbi:MAG: hypothetical protein JNK64_22095 [Myxococcales bacterium]|nr:hypothetical protein [Myxococcales bacterium]